MPPLEPPEGQPTFVSTRSGPGFVLADYCLENQSYSAHGRVGRPDLDHLEQQAAAQGLAAMRLGSSVLLRVDNHVVQVSSAGECSINRVDSVKEAEALFCHRVAGLLRIDPPGPRRTST